ncbi:LysR family transcriptional regulator [Zophobihabitans entericus]|uniref:LysR family transcriptional regulator n=1 Tax=Zophobihabitans entericus TaxID=1635327 RepID=A0A6G9IF06_9GAMM|nr:LysR family transcriptional regulator [Zophobihabitans entericus]QIQ22180.1 LysR family transcriptional regulator [Zophobihabitans entericus]
MNNIDFNSLFTFIIVARERNFTRAAAQLGVSQSALSHSIRRLEEKLGVRLLTRTTRGVSTTEVGERLFSNLGHLYGGIEDELKVLNDLKEKPVGTIRITAHDHAINTILWPKLSKLLPEYPELNFELSIAYEFTDIVDSRFDAGVRAGDQIAKDMIAVRISPDFKMVVVGSPVYFSTREKPKVPQDLMSHNCINLRLATYGGIYAWEFEKKGEKLNIQVTGQMIFNTSPQGLTAALDGYGLCYAPEDLVQESIIKGDLIQVLDDWSPTFPGYHLYYPSRRQSSAAFQLIVNTLRYTNQV